MALPRIFVSHSHVDIAWCEKLVTAFHELGYDAWLDKRELLVGDDWFNSIQDQLVARDVYVLVWSPDAKESYWVNEEIKLAFSQRKRIMPVMLRKAPMTGFLLTRQHIDAVGKAAASIAQGIVASLDRPEETVTPPPAIAVAREIRHFKSLDKSIAKYYQTLHELQQGQGATNEGELRFAFETLLTTVGLEVGWTPIAEQLAGVSAYPDATLRDENRLPRGHWEAKDTKDNLDAEIHKKIAKSYPTENIIFEDTRRAVLYQNGKVAFDHSITDSADLRDVLTLFFTHEQPAYEQFGRAVTEFKARIPALANELLTRITTERANKNQRFLSKYESFRTVCQASIDPHISDAELDEMLIQHLLTKRIFVTVFDNESFVSRNVIAREIEAVIDALTSQYFNPNEFLKGLDRFYLAIEGAAQGVTSYAEKQTFLNVVYESFFQGFAVKQADTHGIVYTPQPIVEFMCNSVEEILDREFGQSLSDPAVQILDPCTGTGNFIVNMINRISSTQLQQKYLGGLFCNEIMLLPYYIASMNIEHAYFQRMGNYQPFPGICFVDTLTLSQAAQTSMFSEANTKRINDEQDAKIQVIIANPPYNAGQDSENDNNKNRKYKDLDARVRETYAKASTATNKNSSSDMYVKFFRWATDRLKDRDGIVCFVSNNSFSHKISLDGMRKHLGQDFTSIYHLNLRGDAHTSGELRRDEGGNIFNNQIRVGVGITILVRNRAKQDNDETQAQIYYHDVGMRQTAKTKNDFLKAHNSMSQVLWEELTPDDAHSWLTEGMRPDFATFLPIGSKLAKAAGAIEARTIFKTYGRGVATSRDDWAYDFDRDELTKKIKVLAEEYNTNVDRWHRRGNDPRSVDDFVTYDDKRIKWSESLKGNLTRKIYAQFAEIKVRPSLYRPFCKEWLYFDQLLNERRYQCPVIFPTLASEAENAVICVSGLGSGKPFHTLMCNFIPCLDMLEKTQCFPFYTYAEDGSNRRENVTDWALAQFQATYGATVTKRDIFHYVYAMLHHPIYRGHYAENLKRELPRIPLVAAEAFGAYVAAGAQLAALHTGYETAPEYPLREAVATDRPFTWRITAMKLTDNKSSLILNNSLRLESIPMQALGYKLGNRSALEWVVDQYRVSRDERSGITNDPNRSDDPQYIARLVRQVVQVSMQTVQIVSSLPDLTIASEKSESIAAI